MYISTRNKKSAVGLDLLCNQIENLLLEAEKKTNRFKKKTGLYCPEGCGDCCRDEHPADAVLALLPAARWVIDHNSVDLYLDHAQSNPEGQCVFFDPNNNRHCRVYSLRPMICRLFGYAGRINKYGGLNFRSCRRLAEYVPELIPMPPLYSDYQFRLTGLYPPLGRIIVPINAAFAQAMEWILIKNEYKKFLSL